MSPEAPGNLIVLDLSFHNGTLLSRVEAVTPTQKSAEWLSVTFHEAPEPKFRAVGNGVAFVRRPTGFEHSIAERPTEIPTTGKLRYAYDNVAHGDGLMLILVLPKGYTIELGLSQPLPRSAKEFNGRLAVYFKPEEGYGKSVTVAWGISEFAGDMRSEAERIRGEIVRLGSAPDNPGVHVDDKDAAGEPPPFVKWLKWTVANARQQPVWALIAFGVVIAPISLWLYPKLFPTCTWDASGAWQINQTDNVGSKSFINLQLSQNGKDFTGAAKSVAGTAGLLDEGEVEGTIDKNDIKFYIFWTRGPVGEYRGSFDPKNGRLQGTAYDKETRVNTASWSVVHLFACK